MEPCHSAEDVDAAIARMYGLDGDALAAAHGVVHVAAVWAEGPGRYRSVDIDLAAPASAHDLFALCLARARADAIITTGRVLRSEPDLVHDLRGPSAPGLSAWRRRLGKHAPPVLLVLSAGQELPLTHPALRAQARPLVFTSAAAAARLARVCTDAHAHFVGVPAPDIGHAIDHLRRVEGHRTIVIEAGPTTTAPLYEPRTRPVPVIDELLLSVFRNETMPVGARSRPFPGPADIDACLPLSSPGFEVVEPSGRWRFTRHTRA
ncbi:hypothetical protein [Haliangium sp.]|uniref:hypothetical protein n=1 Tax=Haliangium sp. TaxID=2663208 RepID=UPI003D1461D0